MSASEARKRANAKWDKAHMTTVGVKLTREQAERFSRACICLGITKGEALRKAVMDTIKASNIEGDEL